jgi:hypothetical protein
MMDPLPGDIFTTGQVLNNTYEIAGVLGRGGTGEVYRARNQITGRVVAIKALNKQFSGNDAYTDLMKREEQMRDIVDDAVVRYTECSRSDQGHVFLVMDYVDGLSMSDVMVRRRMEPRELMIVAHRVAEGLRAAHRKGIVHRDLSPDNIILRAGEPERATIIDFGIAKDTAAGARTIVGNDFAGKYEYAAPEQLEGRAEPRSDLYALGATLLAAFRGQIPFAGATPGEMIRRKQHPLDTAGVPEPLKDLVEWLSAPALADRAPSAEAVVARLDAAIRPGAAKGGAAKARTVMPGPGKAAAPRRRLLWPALMVAVLAAGGGGAYLAGQFDRFFVKPLPVAAPYRLQAGAAALGAARLSGNAPDAASAALIGSAYAAAAGVDAPPDALSLAAGAPSPVWPAAMAAGFDAVAGLEDWSLDVADTRVTASGLAPDTAARDAAAARIAAWAQTNGLTATTKIAAGPRDLPAAAVRDALVAVADCGPLTLGETTPETFALGDTIRVFGDVADAARNATIASALTAIAGDRGVAVETTVLNAPVCTIRQLLPDLPSGGVSLWFGQGATGQANPTGVYHKDDNPVIEVLAPATLGGLALTVLAIEENGDVSSLLPNVFQEQNVIDGLGVVENGVRRITVAHSVQDTADTRQRLAFIVNDESYGKTEIVAILSRADIFDVRRPTAETVGGLAQALSEIRATMPDNIVGIATRLLESRP